MLLEINSVARGGLTTIFDVEEKISQIRKFHFGAVIVHLGVFEQVYSDF